MNRREFQFTEGKSQKFWTIELDGTTHTVQFGRIGTSGQTSRKEFATEAQAKASCDKLVAEKLKKGYVERAAATPAATRPRRSPRQDAHCKTQRAGGCPGATPKPQPSQRR